MSQFRNNGKELTAHFCFPDGFLGFQGHFPGNPVLPGVCKIQAVMCCLEAANKKIPKLKEIILAKFFAPVTSNEEIVFTLRQEPQNNDEALVKASVLNQDKKIAEIHLRVAFEI